MSAIPINPKCSCGDFIIWNDEAETNAAPLFCRSCGQEVGTYSELERQALQIVRDRIEELFGHALLRLDQSPPHRASVALEPDTRA